MSGLTFDYINNTVGSVVTNAEADLKTRAASMNKDTSQAELLMLQQEVSKWTLMTQIQSTLVKEVSDAMKGVIQKAG